MIIRMMMGRRRRMMKVIIRKMMGRRRIMRKGVRMMKIILLNARRNIFGT